MSMRPTTIWPGEDREVDPPGQKAILAWKGTNACLSLNCACGELTHVDSDFMYYVKCGQCDQIYYCSPLIQVIPLTPSESEKAEAEHETLIQVTS